MEPQPLNSAIAAERWALDLLRGLADALAASPRAKRAPSASVAEGTLYQPSIRATLGGHHAAIAARRFRDVLVTRRARSILACLEVGAEQGLPLTVRTVEVDVAVA